MNLHASVVAVSRDDKHRFSKPNVDSIRLTEGMGVEGDAHYGATVKHRSRFKKDATQPNLRQVHLLHTELFEELIEKGYAVEPGEMGENIATVGIDLLGLPRGTRLRLGEEAVVEITGLRNPCVQIDRFQDGLLKQMVSRDGQGNVIRKAGVMGIVLRTGTVEPGDPIRVELPAEPHEALEPI